MKAIVLENKDQPLKIMEADLPMAKAGEVIVQVKAAAFNHRDRWIQKGMYAGLRYPIILGSDGSGIVSTIGEGVEKNLLGKEVIINPGMNWGDDESYQGRSFKVLGLPDNGTFAEFVTVPFENIFDKPAYLSWEEAAAIPLAGLTAYRALFTKGQIKSGDNILISGIGGGVALMAMQMALAAGANVYVTSGSDEKIYRANNLGATLGVNYMMDGWYKLFQSAVDGFDVIIDSAAGDGFKHFVELAKPGGRIVFYGGTQGAITTLNPQKIFWKQLSILGTSMGTPSEFEQMIKLFETHKIKPVLDETIAFEEAEKGLKKLDQSSQFGKIVLASK